MVLPAAASRTFTGLGPMLQPLPSTSEYSCSVASGSVSPTLIMGLSCWWLKNEKRPTLWAVLAGLAARAPQGSRRSDLDGLLDQTGHDPVLGLGDRLAFLDLDHVAGVVLALFVMGVVLARLDHDLAVQRVLHAALDQHGHGLGALVAHHLADESALEGGLGFRHFHSLGLGGFRTLLRQDGLGASDVTTRGTQRGGVGELLRGLLHAQAEVGLLQGLHFGFEAGGVFFAEGLGIGHVESPYWPI